jgi:hypothetical protein
VERCGAHLLVNESHVAATAAGQVRVAGLDDPHRGWPDAEQALRADAQSWELTVRISHGAVAVDLLPEGHGVDLLLTGHTHGGQVRVPFWRRMPHRFYRGLTDGLHWRRGLGLYVSRGFGTVGRVPVRLGCPAEVAIFRLRPPTEADRALAAGVQRTSTETVAGG